MVTRVIEWPINQDEAFDDEPHMRGSGLGGARRDFDGQRTPPVTQRRGGNSTETVLFQHSGERRLANALARTRRRCVLTRLSPDS